MENKDLFLMAVIQNSFALICWMILAIVFNKWWLALFALLFRSNVKKIYRHTRVCDDCGAHCSYGGDTPEKAIEAAAKIGWYNTIDETGRMIDYCPECREKRGV